MKMVITLIAALMAVSVHADTNSLPTKSQIRKAVRKAVKDTRVDYNASREGR